MFACCVCVECSATTAQWILSAKEIEFCLRGWNSLLNMSFVRGNNFIRAVNWFWISLARIKSHSHDEQNSIFMQRTKGESILPVHRMYSLLKQILLKWYGYIPKIKGNVIKFIYGNDSLAKYSSEPDKRFPLLLFLFIIDIQCARMYFWLQFCKKKFTQWKWVYLILGMRNA